MIIRFRREPWTVDSESDSFIFQVENLLEIFFSLPREESFETPKSDRGHWPAWILGQLSSWSCWTTLMTRILAIKSPILLLFCPEWCENLPRWRKMLESNQRNKRKRKKQIQLLRICPLEKNRRSQKGGRLFFPIFPGFAGCLNWIWMHFKMFEFLL